MSEGSFPTTTRVFIAGHRGMVGSAIHRLLTELGYSNVITAPKDSLDLRVQAQVDAFFQKERPECVILAAAKVGGIQANRLDPVGFLQDNLLIQNSVIHAANKAGVRRFVFLGSSCIYPRECPQPIKEEYLLTGPLEPTNEGYALAKIAGLKMTEYYHRQYGFNSLNLMPCNLYGPNDSFDLAKSHVLSALVKRFTDAAANGQKSVTLWGTGRARREFMHVDDLARAVVHMLNGPQPHVEVLNIGSGIDVSIAELASLIADQVGYRGRIEWDTSKPDGMLRKLMDVSRMRALGFEPQITLEAGIAQMIQIYKNLPSL
jgi:GDP-L-fucose synthase